MIIELSLKEAEAVIEFLGRTEPGKFDKTMSTLKKAIKLETETQIEEIDRLMNRIEGSYYDNKIHSDLVSTKKLIQNFGGKARDKWFDGEGNEKRR